MFDDWIKSRVELWVRLCKSNESKIEPFCGECRGKFLTIGMIQQPFDLLVEYRIVFKTALRCEFKKFLIRHPIPEKVAESGG